MGGDLSNFSCLSSGVNGRVSHPRGTRVGPSERRALGQLPLGRLLRKEDCQVLRHVVCSGALPLLFLSLSLLRSFPRELSVHQRLPIGRRVLCGLWLSRLDGEPINQSRPRAWERGLRASPSSSRRRLCSGFILPSALAAPSALQRMPAAASARPR